MFCYFKSKFAHLFKKNKTFDITIDISLDITNVIGGPDATPAASQLHAHLAVTQANAIPAATCHTKLLDPPKVTESVANVNHPESASEKWSIQTASYTELRSYNQIFKQPEPHQLCKSEDEDYSL